MTLEITQSNFSNESENKTETVSFYDACVDGNLKVVKVYVAKQGFDMNVPNNFGITGFYWACCFGRLNVVQFLLQQGCDMNVRVNLSGRTGFHVACRHGHLNVVQFLVQQGSDINIGDILGNTGFNVACVYGKVNVVQFLVQQGVEGINELKIHGKTGLKHLIGKRYHLFNNELFMPSILLLIESGAQLNENDVFKDLISAIQNRIIEITFMKETIFEKWTGRIAQAITDYAIPPFTNTSLQNLSQILD